MKTREHWVFYLKMGRELPRDYFSIDQHFKSMSKSLVPVGLKSLSTMVSQEKNVHVLIVIKNMDDYRFFKRRVIKILKYLMRSDRFYLYVASSFSSVNNNQLMRKDHYNFIKIPVATSYLCGSVSNMIDMKTSGGLKWPGGYRSKFKLAN